MAALGFEKTSTEGRFKNATYEVLDLLPRLVGSVMFSVCMRAKVK